SSSPHTRMRGGVTSHSCSGRMPPMPTSTSSSATTKRSSGSRLPRNREVSRRLGVTVTAALCATAAVVTARQAQPPAASRLTVVMSDVHMGVGRDGTGGWHPYEDFRWQRELSAFLDAINNENRGATDLILNGDTFELLQALDQSCPYSAAGVGCSESEALGRIE